MGIYFATQLRTAKDAAPTAHRVESSRELEKLRRMRQTALTTPLSECVRPRAFDAVIGQSEGIEALMAILCGPNPQHVLIYGPPGIGKTCAARLVLEEAVRQGHCFKPGAPFIEVDATCVRFDERAIADPLIGSVHDPIYQGAGPLGQQGIPQPKPGAVTRAHGGILFIDEIGEMHPIQMNKLLKVLEDRRVMLDSAYYNESDPAIPRHIHDIFKNGYPADFRMIGATTRSPNDLPPALRSRCIEVFFRPLTAEETAQIGGGAAQSAGFRLEGDAAHVVGLFSQSGRDAANIVQVAAERARQNGRLEISTADVEWVARTGGYDRRVDRAVSGRGEVGKVNALAVSGAAGTILYIEASARPARGVGVWQVTGIVEEEELSDGARKVKRRSTASAAAHNARTALRNLGVEVDSYDLHIDFPGGIPVDGPSAGVAMAVAAASAIHGVPADGFTAMTGEVSVLGEVLPVGGVPTKIRAAARGGARRVLVPRENYRSDLRTDGVEITVIDTLEEALAFCLTEGMTGKMTEEGARASGDQLFEKSWAKTFV